jgi:hypothetical protein
MTRKTWTERPLPWDNAAQGLTESEWASTSLKLQHARISERLHHHELFKFGTARAEHIVNFPILDLRRHDHTCSAAIWIGKGADKPKTSAREISEGLYHHELFKFGSARAECRVNFSILDLATA